MNRKPKYVAKLGNVYFLNKVGVSLRHATAGLRTDQLPSDVRRALQHLDRLEFLQKFINPRTISQTPTLRLNPPLAPSRADQIS
jgi:hypothetical protein